MVAEAQISATAAGMSACGDDGGGRDAPRERLGWVAVEEAGALAHAGEGKGEGDGDGMTAAEEEAWVGVGGDLVSEGGGRGKGAWWNRWPGQWRRQERVAA